MLGRLIRNFKASRMFFLLAMIVFLICPFFLEKEGGIKLYGFLIQLIGGVIVYLLLKSKSKAHNSDIGDLMNPFKSNDSSPILMETAAVEFVLLEPDVKQEPPKRLDDVPGYVSEEIERAVRNLEQDFNDKIKDVRSRQMSFESSSNKNFADIRSKVFLRTDDLMKELFGWFCLTYGMILTTFPERIIFLNQFVKG
jgi:hypothetical protein